MTDENALEDLLPDDLFNHPDCFDSRRYWLWERDVAAPALEEMGFEIAHWWTVDGDSFGPLIRAVRLTKNGTAADYAYG